MIPSTHAGLSHPIAVIAHVADDVAVAPAKQEPKRYPPNRAGRRAEVREDLTRLARRYYGFGLWRLTWELRRPAGVRTWR